MAWTTPKVDFNSNDGLGFTDINKTNANIEHLRDENVLFLGVKTFSGSLGSLSTSTNGNILGFSRNAANYINANSVGGELLLVTNGRSLNTANASIFMDTAGGVTLGAGANKIIVDSSGNVLNFTRNSANYIWANSVGGELLLGTNGRSLSAANASVFMPVSGAVILGAGVNKITVGSAGNELGFSRNAANYIWADTAGGELLLGANGRAKSVSESSIFLDTSRNSHFQGHINPTTTPTSGTWTVSGVVPRGQYNIRFDASTDGIAIRQDGIAILTISSPFNATNTIGGSFYSDGINTTVSFGTDNNGSVTYWKF